MVYNLDGELIVRQEELPILKEAAAGQRSESGKFNLVLVVDGTSSMRRYFPNINNAISKFIKSFSQTGFSLKIGGVVYYDYSNEKCGKSVTDVKTLSVDHPSFTDWFQNISTQNSNCSDSDLPEAMYKGIDEGIRLLNRDQQDQTNIMILIGDAGNHLQDERVIPSNLVSKLSQYRTNMLIFQAASGQNPTYDHFVFQSKYIVQNSRKESKRKRSKNK